jgi:HK97 family phage major capsid protein
MNKRKLPAIRMDARPSGLRFKTPASALAKWDRTIQAAARQPNDPMCEIAIMGEIGDYGCGAECITATQVKDMLKAAGNAPVKCLINSPGGDAFEGIAIYNLFREHPGNVTMHVLGMAASAASIVAMAGDKIEMAEAAQMMIHSAWGMVVGNRNDMLDMADMLDKVDTSVAELYARRSGKPAADVIAMMNKETWMTGQDAVDNGFADTCASGFGKKGAKAALPATPVFAQRTPAVLHAASGNATQRGSVRLNASLPGASGHTSSPKGHSMKTIAEQIASFEAKRHASAARMTDIMSKAGDEGRTLDEAETQEYDGLNTEIKTIDAHLVRLKDHEQNIVASAAAIDPAAGTDPNLASQARAGNGRAVNCPHSGIISVRSNLAQGVPFVRYVKAMCRAKGIPEIALMIAKSNQQWTAETPEVAQVLMAAVAAGDTTTAGWASELVYNQNLTAAFLEYLRPRTIIGRIQGFTQVPFNVRWGTQTSGSTGYWVGQAKPIPVSKLGTGADTLGIAKAAGMVVLDKELIMSSSPSAEVLVRNDLAKAIQQFLDVNFIAPDYAAVANVNPASITNGVNPTAATGTAAANLRTDVQTLFSNWDSNNLSSNGAVWVMAPATARAISLMLNALGQPVFPTMTPDGGTFMGYPAVVSLSSMQVGSPVAGEGNLLVLICAPEIAMADEGGVTIDASAEAAIEMLDNPTNTGAGATTATSMVSMFQTDSVALRAIRHINWKKRRTFAVQYIKDAAYVT